MVFLSPELDGAMFGFGVMCYSNSVRRLRMMRRKFLHPPSTVGQRVRSPLRVSAACSIAGPWEHAGMMAAGAALGAGLSALNASEKTKMEERLMVQRLRNQSILPRAFARPPATPATPALAPRPAHVPWPQHGRSPRCRPPCSAVMLNCSAGCACARMRVNVQLRPAALEPLMRVAMTTEHVSRCPEPRAQCCVSHNEAELTFRPLVFVSLVHKRRVAASAGVTEALGWRTLRFLRHTRQALTTHSPRPPPRCRLRRRGDSPWHRLRLRRRQETSIRFATLDRGRAWRALPREVENRFRCGRLLGTHILEELACSD